MCTWSWSPFHACGEVLNWGDVPTATATLFAALAAFFAYRAFQLERERDQDRHKAEIRSQAELVSIYFGGIGEFGTPIRLLISNRSNQPITQTEAYLIIQDRRVRAAVSPGVVPPGQASIVLILSNEVKAPPEGPTDEQWGDMLGVTVGKPTLIGGYPEEVLGLRVGVRFVDASGSRRWHRHPDGKLVLEEPS